MDISSLLSSLSADDVEKLKETAQQFFGSKTEKAEKKEHSSSIIPDFPFDPKMLTGVAKFSKMMNENDERCDFIMALKPLLSEGRQKKANDAVMLLKFMKIVNAMQENGQ